MNEICLYELEGEEYRETKGYLDAAGYGCSCRRCQYQSRRVAAKRRKVYEHPLFLASLVKLKPHAHQFFRDGDIHRCKCGEILEYEQ